MPELRPGGDMNMARDMAGRMRAADVLEVARAARCSPLEGLRLSLDMTRNAFHIEHLGVVLAMGGCSPIPGSPGGGTPWMLGTDGLFMHKRWLLQHTPDIWATVSHQYDYLWNFVDAQNLAHVRWLEWSGCRFIGRRELNGNPFLEFVRDGAAHCT